MSSWILHYSELTPDQQRVVEFPLKVNRVVYGPTGSGKTQVLIHRAYYLAYKYKVQPDKFRVFVFTNVVKNYIKSGLQSLNLPEETVSTFDHWCRLLYEEQISRRLPRKLNRIDFNQIRLSVLELLRKKTELQKRLEFVLVDEGQDLKQEVYEILTLSANHITVFADPQQKIFEDGASETFIIKALGLTKRNAVLLGGYRNSPYVAQLASYFISDTDLRQQYLSQKNTKQQVRERPLLYLAPSFEKEAERLAEIIHSRQISNERIGIIVDTNRKLFGLAKGLEKLGVEIEKAVARDRGNIHSVNFNDMSPKIATYHSGLHPSS